MKSLIAFSHELLDDVGKWCGVSTSRDHKTITSRCEHEGLSFLTISLPAFGKDFERSLDLGQIDDDLFMGYARTGGLPRFLGGFLRLVFNPSTGTLLELPSIEAIRAIRQFTLAFAKVEIDCTPRRVAAAIAGYIQCENDINDSMARVAGLLPSLTKSSMPLFSELFTKLDLAVFNGEHVPKHGPGSTADRVLGNEKFTLQSWPRRLDAYFPMGEFVIPNWSHWQHLDGVEVVEPGDELPVRVITVPKTLKTPRIIAVEPVAMQYSQQALMEMIVEGIEGDDILSPFIGFTDQVPNRILAQRGSLTGSLATLDLSEASDRVTNQHVLALLANHPHLREAVQACRSTKADVPGYGVVPLSKFASMGSALCFPFEAMVFTSIIFGRIARELGVPVTKKLVKSFEGRVRVYGDDIIVPVEFAPGVASELEDFGLKVNRRKSFWNGQFRESCGGDFYRGAWVTPVRVRSEFPESSKHVARISSTVSLRNQLFAVGAEKAVAFLDRIVSRVLPVYPLVPVGTPGLGRHTFDPVVADRMCAKLQIPLIKVCMEKSTPPSSKLEGVGALMKFFLRRGDEPLERDSFIRAGRPVSARITTQYVPLQRMERISG